MPTPPPATPKARAVAKKFPSHLKAAANPLDTFGTLAELKKELPGAASTGFCEQGLELTLGAGFDFGPLLTFGAPVATAEVGAEVGVSSTDCLLLALVHQPSVIGTAAVDRPLSLSQLSGWRLGVTAKLEAKVGLGLPEEFGEYFKAVPAAPTGGVLKTVDQNSLGNPLEPEDPEEVEVEEEAPTPEPAANAPQPEADPEPDSEDAEAEEPDESDNAALGVEATAMLVAEASVGYSYMLLRESNPQWYTSAADKDLVELLSVTLSGSTKEQLKLRAVELLSGATVDTDPPEKTAALLENLVRLKPLLADHAALETKRAACEAALRGVSANEATLQTAARAAPFLTGVVDSFGKPQFQSSSDDSPAVLLRKLDSLIAQIAGGTLLAPAVKQTAQTLRLQGSSTTRTTDQKAEWKRATVTLLQTSGSGIPGATPSTNLKGDYTTSDLNTCLDALKAAADKIPALEKDAPTIRAAVNARLTAEKVAEAKAAAKKTARAFILAHGANATFTPDRPWFGRSIPAVKLTKQLQAAVASGALGAEAKALIADLRRLSRDEQRKLKNEAVAYLAAKKDTSKLPSLGTSSRTLLIECLAAHIADPKAKQLSDALGELSDTAEELVPGPYAHLTYLCARSPKVGAGVTAKAKIKGGVQLGENLASGQAGVQASAEVEASRARTRLQTIFQHPSDKAPVVQTQDVKVTTWSAALGASASAKVGNKTVAEAGVEREFGGLRWQAATLRWSYPSSPAKAVVSLPGSGLSFGRSVKLERFLKKVAGITNKTNETPYMRRLANALRISVPTVRAFLAATFGREEFVAGLELGEDTEALLIEATFALQPGAPFLVAESTSEKLKKFFVSGTTVADPKLEVQDTRAPMKKLLKEHPGALKFQSISVRYRLGDEEDASRTLFQLSHSYVVVATAKVTRVQKANTNGLVEVLTWWPDLPRRKIDRGGNEAAQS